MLIPVQSANVADALHSQLFTLLNKQVVTYEVDTKLRVDNAASCAKCTRNLYRFHATNGITLMHKSSDFIQQKTHTNAAFHDRKSSNHNIVNVSISDC